MSLFKKLVDLSVDEIKSQAKTVLQIGKDSANSAMFKAAMNPLMRKYGQVLAFKIDSKDKALIFEIMLKGEVKPIRIEVKKYEFIEEAETQKFFVKIHRLSANRYWMDTIMEKFVVGKEFELPIELNRPIRAFM